MKINLWNYHTKNQEVSVTAGQAITLPTITLKVAKECAEICKECADACSHHTDDGQECMACMKICKECEEACKKFAA